MKNKILLLLALSVRLVQAQPSGLSESADKITIEAETPPGYSKKTITLRGCPATVITSYGNEGFSTEQSIEKDNSNKWEIPTQKPLFLFGDFVLVPRNLLNYVAEPGDNIQIKYGENNKPIFSGRGAEKFTLITRLAIIIDSFNRLPEYKTLSVPFSIVSSVQDYLNWNNFLNKQVEMTSSVIESYKSRLSPFSFASVKEGVFNLIESTRLQKFKTLCLNIESPSSHSGVNQFGLTNEDLCAIYDSTLNGPAARWILFETPVVNYPYYYFSRSSSDAYREKGKFYKERESDTSIIAANKVDGYVYRYYLVKSKYNGIIREAALAFFFHFPKGLLKTVGLDPRIKHILKDYYKLSKYPEYAKAVKEFELKVRERETGIRDYGFTLTGMNNELVDKSKLTGSITLFDFWFTGCTGCIQMVPALRNIEKQFENDKRVQFVNVSIDKDKNLWKESLLQKKYTTGSGLSLYTGGVGNQHSIIHDYLITSYPSLILLDSYGRSISPKSYKDPRTDSGKSLSSVIQRQLDLMNDGPYVFKQKSRLELVGFSGKEKYSKIIQPNAVIQVKVAKDSVLEFPLKKDLRNEKASYQMPEKILALSDIEGNLPVLKNLLKANGVIDNNFNWSFGKGHLVFIGDMFDRGEQVTECLWLLYSLEEKAQEAGGYVHFILGNHEIMNLQGDHRYTQNKYKHNASDLGKNLKELYDEKSELGKWLRSKNIIEKIGNLLFIHGGVSQGINSLKFSPDEINNIARPYYDSYKDNLKNKSLKLIMNDKNGIFWNRNYYKMHPDEIEGVIDETLRTFSVDHIITGHTLTNDGIGIEFNGKVFNTDTHHSAGKSEALYIENGSFYRADIQGRKQLLYSTK